LNKMNRTFENISPIVLILSKDSTLQTGNQSRSTYSHFVAFPPARAELKQAM